MIKMLYAEVDLVGIVILMIMLFTFNKRLPSESKTDQKLFKALLVTNIAVLFFDGLMWVIDKQNFTGAYELNVAVSVIYFILNPIFCLIWLVYCDYKLNESLSGLKKRKPIYIIPSAINLVIAVCSPFTGWAFYIANNNQYHRGNWFFIVPALSLFYLLQAIYITLKKSFGCDYIKAREMRKYFLIFPIFPIIGSIFQSIFFGVSIIWILTAIMLMMVFINIQNDQISTDPLTGLYNRRRLENYLEWAVKNMPKDELLFAILVDIDKFKSINDRFGHVAGDNALINVANILKKCGGNKTDFVARYGGDEFLIVGESKNEEVIDSVIQKIKDSLDEFNSSHCEEYQISLSMGHAVYGRDGINSIDSFIGTADHEMYNNKTSKK